MIGEPGILQLHLRLFEPEIEECPAPGLDDKLRAVNPKTFNHSSCAGVEIIPKLSCSLRVKYFLGFQGMGVSESFRPKPVKS
jgi:hypothetical protein